MKLSKIIFSMIIAVVVLLGAGSYFAYLKVKDIDVDRYIQTELSNSFPRLKFDYKKSEINWAWNISLKLNEIKLSDQKKEVVDLLASNSFEINIPWWSILTQKGTILVKLKQTDMNLNELKNNQNNWSLVLASRDEKETQVTKSGNKKKEKISLGEKLSGGLASKLGISLDIENLKYQQKSVDGSQIKLVVNELKLNDFSLNKSASYKLRAELDQNNELQAGIDLSGQVRFLVDEERVNFEGPLFLKKMKYTEYIIPNLETTIKGFYSLAKGSAGVDLQGSFQSKPFEMKINYSDEVLNIPTLKIQVDPAPIIKNESVKSLPLKISGQVITKNEELVPEISFTSLKPGLFYNESVGDIRASFTKGNIKGDSLETEMKGELLKGSFSSEIKGLYPEEKRNLKINFEGTKLNYENFIFDTEFQSTLLKKSYVMKPLKLQIGDGNLIGNLRLVDLDKSRGDFYFKLNKVQLSSFKPFAKDYFQELKGVSNGNINGSFNGEKELDYAVNYDLNIKDGMFKGVDFTKEINNLVSKVNSFKPGALKSFSPKLSDGFKVLDLVGSLNTQMMKIKKIKYLDDNNSSLFNGDGQIFLQGTNKKSKMSLIYSEIDKKKSEKLEKELGEAQIEVPFIGLETNLKPDYRFITKKLSKSLLKKEVNKQKGKLEEKAGKEIKKIFKNKKIEETANKLLKGLFR